MTRKKMLARKSRRPVCDACGTGIAKTSAIARTFDGSTFRFDSDDCLLIFKKLRAVYGKNFFSKLSD